MADEESGVRIQPMTTADFGAVDDLWRNSPGVGLGPGDEHEARAAYLDRNPGLSLVAHRGDDLVGAVLCGHDGRRGSIYHLAVAPSERGRGLGSELVRRCLAGLAADGIAKCNIVVYGLNADGFAFWRATGWTARDDLVLMQHAIESAASDG